MGLAPSIGGRVAAVNDDDFAVDHAVSDDQADDHFSHILGCDTTAERRAPSSTRHQIAVPVFEHAHHPISLQPSGRYRVDANSRSEIESQQLSEVDERSLAGGIGQ